MCAAQGFDIARPVARAARETALQTLRDAPVAVDILIVDRSGSVIAHAV
jgi:cobalt-precorrin-5B (C1)-methyltransferase